MNVIEVKEMSKIISNKYQEHVILDNISINLKSDDYVAIMGASGSGKSSLLHQLSGIDTISEGAVYFKDKSYSDMSNEQKSDLRRMSMGFIFQNPAFLIDLSIVDNIILPSSLRSKRSRSELLEKARSIMEAVGILELENRRINEVSGGQLQRASICRALMNDPEVLFADEPTGALNTKNREEVMMLFDMIHESKKAIVVVTHDPQVAVRARRIILMKDGKIIEDFYFDAEMSDSDKRKKLQAALEANQI